jgi:aromatic-L-amino-acid/L-tryptophan decarboxylase
MRWAILAPKRCLKVQAARRAVTVEPISPPNINIVRFRYHPKGRKGDGLKALNIEIMLRLQEQGIAAPSDTGVRVAINNHRTKRYDIELLARKTIQVGARL